MHAEVIDGSFDDAVSACFGRTRPVCRGPGPWYGFDRPLEVDEDQLKREAMAARELMKEMS
jgi:hypothetical protein